MKKSTIIILFILFTGICYSQSDCKLSDLQQKIYAKIENDKDHGYNALLINQLTLSLDLRNENLRSKEHKFSYNTGFVFRIYLLSSATSGFKPCLKLYSYDYEDNSTPPELLKSVYDDPEDDEITVLEFENTRYLEFILELSIEEAKSGCVMSIFTVYPKE